MNGPTRVTSSSQTQIDLMFTNRPERIMKTYNLLTGISDHNITLLARKLTRKRFDSRVQTKCNSQRIPKNEMNNFENALRQIDWSSLLHSEDIRNSSDMFLTTINKIISSFTRKVKNKSRQKMTLPWLNDALWQQMKERDFALKRALKSGHSNGRHIFISLRNKVVRNIRKAKAEFFIRIIEDARGNGKIIWKNLNKLTGRNIDHRQSEIELKINGILIQDQERLTNIFIIFFLYI